MTPIDSKTPFLIKAVTEEGKNQYQSSRSHNITLASFSIAAIALITSRNDLNIQNLQFGIAYLSIAMFCFFIGSYLFVFRQKGNIIPYYGETLELAGILSLGIGFFYVVTQLFLENVALDLLYLAFFFTLVGVAAYELRLNIRYFYPRQG